MNASERKAREERRVIHPATYRVRHDSGDTFEVHGLTLARVRKLIEAECHDRGWLIDDTVTIVIDERKREKVRAQ